MKLADEFKVKSYPTFILVNENGEPIDRWSGYKKRVFVNSLGGATSDLATIDRKLSRYRSEPNLKDAVVLGRYYFGIKEYEKSVEFYNGARSLNDDPGIDYTFEIFNSVSRGVSKKMFTFNDLLKAADAVLESKSAVAKEKVRVVRVLTGVAKQRGNTNVLAPYLQKGMDAVRNESDPELKRKHDELMSDYALLIERDKAKAAEYKKASMPPGWSDNPGQLNKFCRWGVKNNVNLKEAEELARKSVGLAVPGRQKARNLYTLAEICNMLGRVEDSIALMKEAIAETPENKQYSKQLRRYEMTLKSKK